MKYILLVLFIVTFNLSRAQRYSDEPPKKDDEVKSLLSKNNELNGFGNLDIRIGNIMDKETMMIGAYGGVIVNRKVMLGLAGYGLATALDFDGVHPESGTPRQLNLYGGYGGMILGIMIASKEVVHISIPVILAAGNLDVSDDTFFASRSGKDAKYDLESSRFFVVEPGIQAEINVSKVFRIGLGAGYRIARGLDLVNVDDGDLTKFTGVVSFKFGVF